MSFTTQLITDIVGFFAILAGIRHGFKWLDRRLEIWIRDEVKKTVHSELEALEEYGKENRQRIELVEIWIKGFQVGRIPAGTDLTDP